VLGGGGAARAVVYGLKLKGAQATICNRSQSKAETIANDFDSELMPWNDFNTKKAFDVVISTIIPEVLPPFWEQLNFHTLLDASYKQSKISEFANNNGQTVITGKRWLLHQAIEAFRLIMGENPPIQIMENALSISIKKTDLHVLEYHGDKSQNENFESADLIVSAKSQTDQSIKAIIDEEISKAFAG
jgi:shikimate dehydrogenase